MISFSKEKEVGECGRTKMISRIHELRFRLKIGAINALVSRRKNETSEFFKLKNDIFCLRAQKFDKSTKISF